MSGNCAVFGVFKKNLIPPPPSASEIPDGSGGHSWPRFDHLPAGEPAPGVQANGVPPQVSGNFQSRWRFDGGKACMYACACVCTYVVINVFLAVTVICLNT